MDLREDVKRQLAQHQGQLAVSNPDLYRHLALYLQVLRSGLLTAVQQACFHLATQVEPSRYHELPSRQRQHLHQRMASLVARTTSLLTVEQVAHLAGQLERKRLNSKRSNQERLIAALEARASSDGDAPSLPTPEGSINLGLALPLAPELFEPRSISGLLPMEDGGSPFGDRESQGPSQEDDSGFELPADMDEAEHLQAVEAMVAAFGEVLSSSLQARGPEDAGRGVDTGDGLGDDADDDSDEASGDGEAETRPLAPWDQAHLPRNPVALLLWLDGFERAIAQRLRNLSHALNVELLRQGVSRSLLPVSLLDAALKGQLEPLSAPANVLRVPLPFGSPDGPAALEAGAVLLRLSDLELEQPKLRTCRSRVQQHRQELRRMAQHYRRLERRLQSLEAEQLWLQDITTAQAPPETP
uniref:hypothetical protein n=1 Tax=Cyanobium sp. TaxID=2164130 RepID=UPI0040480637